MYLGFTQVDTQDGVVSTVSDLGTVPAKASWCELQADTQPMRYTMDNSTTPSATAGMVMAVAHQPKPFGIEDLKRIKFLSGTAGNAGKLNVHYFGGRDT